MSFKKKRLDEVKTALQEECLDSEEELEEHEPEYLDSDTEGDSAEPEAETEEHIETTTALNSKALIKSIRRKANPDNWKQVVRKKLRQAGQEYVNAQGKVMAQRRMHEGCGAGCYLKCTQRFTPEQRQLIHATFWKLTDEQKNNFYWKYTSRVEPKRRRVGKGENSKRGCTFKYRFEVRGELLPVCSKFFFATLDISARRIYYFYEHCYQEDICMPRQPLRGKTRKRSVPNIVARLEEIREHIKTFPNTRLGGNKKRYLAADLNLTRMYKMYTEWAKEPLKQHWYSKVFHEEFNLGFRPNKTTEKSEKLLFKKEKKIKNEISEINGGVTVRDTIVGLDETIIPDAEPTITPRSMAQQTQQQWPQPEQVWQTTNPQTAEQPTTNSPYPNYVELHWMGDVKRGQ